ncbi:hypothetical protein B6I21_04885 [candidate division KSB1 bacterium 4572_119]|nr:MAG: hypothetical protein B6I21_04885 [candidate division KSB1 bacterium 4572_119]
MKLSKITLIFITLLGIFLIFGCSANQPDISTEEGGLVDEMAGQDQSEIDELFQIINQNESQQEESTGEDEVFELLGIDKKQNEQGTVQEQTKSEDQLKNEIEMLEQRLADKDAEINELKTNVEQKDNEINQLEAGATQQYETQVSTSELTGNFKQDYQIAWQEYNNRRYKSAIQMFQDLLAIDQNNSLSDNCRYWIGECYYGLGDFNQAIIEFTKVFSFTNSNKMADAQLKLGLCYWRLGDSQRAAQEFERLINDFPDSEYIDKAREFLARLQ